MAKLLNLESFGSTYFCSYVPLFNLNALQLLVEHSVTLE